MKFFNFIMIFILNTFTILIVKAEERILTLQDAIILAQEQSLEAKEAKKNMRIAYWDFRTYKAKLLPNIELNGTLPNLNKSLSYYQLEDGSYKFISNSSVSEKLSISLIQNIPLTGGRIYLSSDLERIDMIGDGSATSYLSVPAVITLQQPIFSYNELKWLKKIEPLRYSIAQKQYAMDMEHVSLLTITHYFNLLLSKINLDIAEQNLKNSTALYEIALGKKEIGLISQNDVQQLKLGKLNASAAIVEAKYDYEEKTYKLCNFLGLSENETISPVVPYNIPELDLVYEKVLDIVKQNNPFSEQAKQRILESKRNLSYAKSQRGFEFDIYASIGFTNADKHLGNVYKNLSNRQLLTIGVKIPILDWGTGRGKVEIARIQQQIEEADVKHDERDLEQNVKTLVNRLLSQKYLMKAYGQADTVAQNRYKVAFETFAMGKNTVLDINTAQTEEDEAKRRYINQLYYSWYYLYSLRQLSLYDFIENKNIIKDFK